MRKVGFKDKLRQIEKDYQRVRCGLPKARQHLDRVMSVVLPPTADAEEVTVSTANLPAPPSDPRRTGEVPSGSDSIAADLKANPRPAFHGDQPALSPRMEAKVQKAMELIDKKGKVKGLSVAKEIGVKESTFRKHYVPILERRGIRNDGDGYYRPKEGDKA